MTAEIKARDPGEKIFWLALLLLFIKLILLPFAQNTDPDAVLRVLGSGEWKNHPAWITSGAWAPFHFYLNGIFLMLWNHPIYMPVVLNMLLSSLTLFPFYYFTRREFDKRGAFIATIFLAICPVLFRNSLLPLSETPYLLFMVLTMNLISKGTREEKKYHFLLAGLSITIASGFRYEAWFMIVLLGIVILLLKKWKGFFLFGSVAVLFPVLWMFQSHWATGNSLNSFQWAFHAMNNKEVLGMESYLRRTWFFPFSWMIALGPPAAFVTAREMIRCYRRENRSSHLAIWTLPFWAVLLFFFYNDMRGSLLLQHRFSGTLIIFSLPFFALYFKDYSSKKTRNAWAFGILTVGLSFAWNTDGVRPLPRLKDQAGEKVSRIIHHEISQDSGLILDFWSWENTYYTALQSRLPLHDIVIIFGSEEAGIQKEKIGQLIKEHPDGVILLKKNSPLFHEILLDNNQLRFKWIDTPLTIQDIFHNDELMVFKYVCPGEKKSILRDH